MPKKRKTQQVVESNRERTKKKKPKPNIKVFDYLVNDTNLRDYYYYTEIFKEKSK